MSTVSSQQGSQHVVVNPEDAPLDTAEPQETLVQALKLSYEINGKRILTNVNATFEPRRLTALMGPSGAGKTTLLNVLAGRAPGERRGEVLVNGVAITSLKKMRSLLSYMPQDDILYAQLTVKQLLKYAALMRCPRSWSRQRKFERAESIAATLGLRRVSDNHVHSISGGQKRRCSAAIEFLSGRPILFMDEPTSGLDSATAIALVDQLRDAAHGESRTVVATIHSPSWDLLGRFDRLSVLAPLSQDRGGTIVFDGSPALLPSYFADGRSPCPEGENPADHFMYLLSDDLGCDTWADLWQGSEAKQDAELRDRAERKRLGVEKDLLTDKKEDNYKEEDVESAASSSGSSSYVESAATDIVDLDGDYNVKYPISFHGQFRVLFMRTAHIFVTDRQQGPLIAKMMLATYTVVILLLFGMPPNLSKANTVFYFIVMQYTMSMTPLVIIMPEEKAVILREYRNGVFSANVYWLARVSLALCCAATNALVTTLFVYPLIDLALSPLMTKLSSWYLFQFLYLSCIMLLGMTIGVLSPSPLVGIKMIVAIQIPWIVTAGVLPPTSMIRPALFYFRYPNLFTWAAKLALVIGFTSHGGKARNIVTDELKFHPGDVNSCYGALAICFGVLFFAGLLATRKALNATDASAGVRPQTPAIGETTKSSSGGKERQKSSPETSKKKQPTLSVSGPENSAAETTSLVVHNPLLDRLLEEEAPPTTFPRKRSPVNSNNNSSPTNYGAVDDMETGVQSVSCELRAVSYRFKRTTKKSIDNVTVGFEAGTITAVMGPSGAGKTTLLNLLSGRLPVGGKFVDDLGVKKPLFEGQVLIDGRLTTAAAFKSIGTLTPQDEIVPTVLTVRQTLAYTAEMRSPAHWTPAQRAARVSLIIEKLGLTSKADNVVGSPSKIGISGGQKKRLSIGMDLLAELPVMLVDEPTTGLDASAALQVVLTLVRLATDQRRTIVSTVHQPPWSMVLRFDQLVLLARGSLVFDGPPSELVSMLSGLGRRPPPEENPCDFAMLLLVTEGPEAWLRHRRENEAGPGNEKKSKEWAEKRKQNEQILSELLKTKKDTNDMSSTSSSFVSSMGGQDDLEFELDEYDGFLGEIRALLFPDHTKVYAVPQYRQAWILFRRIGYIFLIDEDQCPEFIMPCLIASTITGLSFRNFGTNVFLGNAILMTLFAHGMIVSIFFLCL